MRELIEAVRAEAQKAFQDATDRDEYHREEMEKNKHARDKADQRIKDCNLALDAITNAARQLTGAKP